MKRLCAICLVLITPLFYTGAMAKAPSKTIIGKPLPESIVFTTLNGESVDVVKDTGNYVINYWASWCVPCATELPILQSMLPALKHANITPVLINVDRRPAQQAPKALQKWGVTKITSYAGDMYEAFKVFNVQGIPIVVSIKNGKIIDIMDLNTHKWDTQGTLNYFNHVFELK